MKIGILADWLGLGLEGGIRKAKEMGADGVQLYAVRGELAPENADVAKRRWLGDLVGDLGMDISALCGDLGQGGFAFPEHNPEKIARTKEIVDLASDLGCSIVTTHIGVVPHDPDHPRFAIIKAALKELGTYAFDHGVCFAIETGPEPSDDLARMLEEVASPGIGVNMDPANIIMSTGEDPVHAVQVLGKYIVHTHAKDGIRIKPCDMDIMYHMVEQPVDYREADYCLETPLGEGEVHFDTYIPALRSVGFDGYLTIEREVNDPVRDIALAVDFLRPYL